MMILRNNDQTLAFEVNLPRNIDIENKVPFWDHDQVENAMEDIINCINEGPYSKELNDAVDRFNLSFPDESISTRDLSNQWVLTEVLFAKEPNCVVVNTPHKSLHLWLKLDESLMRSRDLDNYDLDQITLDCRDGDLSLTEEVSGSEWTLDGERLYRSSLQWVLLTFTRVGGWAS